MILDVLTTIWQKTNMPCSKRLKQIIPLWLPFFPNYTIPEDIKEKLLAAHRAGVKTVVLPAKNKSNLREIPLDIQQELHIAAVDEVSQAIDLVLADTEKTEHAARAHEMREVVPRRFFPEGIVQ